MHYFATENGEKGENALCTEHLCLYDVKHMGANRSICITRANEQIVSHIKCKQIANEIFCNWKSEF